MLLEREPEDDMKLSRPDGLCTICGGGLKSVGGRAEIESRASWWSSSKIMRTVEPLTSLLLARYARAGGSR